jgi:hypothetical protein
MPAAALPPASASCATETLSQQQTRAALAAIAQHIRSAHYGSLEGIPPTLATALETLRREAPPTMPAWKFASAVNRALATANDGHLALHLRADVEAHCPRLPLAFTWGDTGLLVRSGGTVPAGARVISIGGKSLLALQQEAVATIPHENVYWARAEMARQLTRLDGMLAYGLTATDGTVTVTFEGPEGTTQSQRIAPTEPSAPPQEWISYKLFPERSTGLLRLSRMGDNQEASGRLKEFFAGVIQNQIRKVVVDLRGNPGGDVSLAVAILRYLGQTKYESFSADIRASRELLEDQPRFDPEKVGPAFLAFGLKPPPTHATRFELPGPIVLAAIMQGLGDAPPEVAADRRLFLLVDGGTFSSAALFALLVRDNHLGLLVGEPVGTSTGFHGEEVDIRIPNLDYDLSVSTTRLDRPDRDAGLSPTILPDIYLPVTGSALASGKDDALDYVLRADPLAIAP